MPKMINKKLRHGCHRAKLVRRNLGMELVASILWFLFRALPILFACRKVELKLF